MSPDYKNIVSRISDLGRRVVPEGSRILLYGSRSRGDNRQDSDWDLLILLNRPRILQEDYDNVVYPITELGWGLNQQIIPVIYTKDEWDLNSHTPFYKNVMNDAIILV